MSHLPKFYYNQGQFYNPYYKPNIPPVPFPPHFYQIPAHYPPYFPNYREPPTPTPQSQNQVPPTSRRSKSSKNENKTSKVKREAVVVKKEANIEVPRAPQVPVPFVFTEKERADYINSLKNEENLYDLFEDIPNTGPIHHSYSRVNNPPTLPPSVNPPKRSLSMTQQQNDPTLQQQQQTQLPGNVPKEHFSFRILNELSHLATYQNSPQIIEQRLNELKSIHIPDQADLGANYNQRQFWKDVDRVAYEVCDRALDEMEAFAMNNGRQFEQAPLGKNCWVFFNYMKSGSNNPNSTTSNFNQAKRPKFQGDYPRKERFKVLWASRSLLNLLGDVSRNPFLQRGRSLENHMPESCIDRLRQFCRRFEFDADTPNQLLSMPPCVEKIPALSFDAPTLTNEGTICKYTQTFRQHDLRVWEGNDQGCCDKESGEYNLFCICINPTNPESVLQRL